MLKGKNDFALEKLYFVKYNQCESCICTEV